MPPVFQLPLAPSIQLFAVGSTALTSSVVFCALYVGVKLHPRFGSMVAKVPLALAYVTGTYVWPPVWPYGAPRIICSVPPSVALPDTASLS